MKHLNEYVIPSCINTWTNNDLLILENYQAWDRNVYSMLFWQQSVLKQWVDRTEHYLYSCGQQERCSICQISWQYLSFIYWFLLWYHRDKLWGSLTGLPAIPLNNYSFFNNISNSISSMTSTLFSKLSHIQECFGIEVSFWYNKHNNFRIEIEIFKLKFKTEILWFKFKNLE